jgi:hypothetical protein
MTTKTMVEFITRNGARAFDADQNEIPLFGPKYQEKTQRGSHFLQCVFCGRDTSKQGKSVGVIVSDGGASIVFPGDISLEQSDAGFMGWFPVGSECIKAIPSDFRQANIYDDKVKGV